MYDDSAQSSLTLASGESVLISGPPMTAKYELLLDLLTHSADRLIVVSTNTSAERVRRDITARSELSDDQVAVVDCTTKPVDPSVSDTELTRYVSSPENLTQVGVQFTSLMEQFDEYDSVAVGLHSLSPLLMYWDAERVYQFLRVFLDRVRETSWSCVAVIGSTMHDEQVLHTLYDPFDSVVETRESDGNRELRRRDRRGRSSEWRSF